MFGAGVVPCVSEADTPRETEMEKKGRWMKRQEEVTQDSRCETRGKVWGGEAEKEGSRGAYVHA